MASPCWAEQASASNSAVRDNAYCNYTKVLSVWVSTPDMDSIPDLSCCSRKLAASGLCADTSYRSGLELCDGDQSVGM